MFDNNIDVTNSGGDQDYGQNVHWRIVSGMVADLVGDCERSRRQHEMGQDFIPPWVNMKKVSTANMKQMTVTKSYRVFILAVQLFRPAMIVTSAVSQCSTVNRNS